MWFTQNYLTVTNGKPCWNPGTVFHNAEGRTVAFCEPSLNQSCASQRRAPLCQLIDFQLSQHLGIECLTTQTSHNTFSRCCATNDFSSADIFARNPALSHLRGGENEIQSTKNNAGEKRLMKNEYSKGQFGRVLSETSSGQKCLSVSLSHLPGTWELHVILNCLRILQKLFWCSKGWYALRSHWECFFWIEMWHFKSLFFFSF